MLMFDCISFFNILSELIDYWVYDWFAGNSSVLCNQTNYGGHYSHPSAIRLLLRWRLEVFTRLFCYRKSSIKPCGGWGGLFISSPFEGEFNRDRGLIWVGSWGKGGLFNLDTMMVSVLHKELEYKEEKLKYKNVEVTQPRIRIKSKLPVSK